MSQPRLLGLFYVEHSEGHRANLKASNNNPLLTYLLCASLCEQSCERLGLPFSVITNDADFLNELAYRNSIRNLQFIGHRFCWQIPKSIPFYSAHFKLEVIRRLGQARDGQIMGLIDLDTILFRPIPLPESSLAVYEISDQMPYETHAIAASIEKLTGIRPRNPRWFGGEFLLGGAKAFQNISSYIERVWPRYVANMHSCIHVGDETVLSAALNIAIEDGLDIDEYGSAGHVARWWSGRTQRKQPPFSCARKAALLHLPADKEFLSTEASRKFAPAAFLRRFERHARRKIFVRRLAAVVDLATRRPRKYVPEL